MARGGFFTRQDAKEARSANSRVKGRTLSETTMRKLGSAGVKQLNPWAKNPNMQPSIPEDAQVLVLGDFPTEKDDERGRHYSGKSGSLLRGMIPMWAQDETAFDYILRTYPGENPKIRPEWIGCFRGEVEKTILSMRPKVVIGLGHRVCNWMLGIPDSRAVRGKKHPVKIGDHTFWFVPTLCPRILLANEDNRLDKVPGEEYIRVVTAEIQRAYELVDSDEEPYVVPEAKRRAPVTYCLTVDEVEAACRKLAKRKSIGFDTESTNLRPYWKSSELLSVAFSDGKHNYAIPLEHPQAPWTPMQLKKVKRALVKLTESGVRMVAHNLCHDLEWWRVYLGQSVYEGEWGCSLEAAFVLDPGPPGDGSAGHSLNHVTKRLFGFAVKDLATAAMNVTRLREIELMKVLEYNAYDAEWCLKAWKELVKEIKEQGLEDAYWLQIDRIPAIVETQFIGVPIDQGVRQELSVEFHTKLEKVKQKIAKDPDVRRFEKATNQKFNPSSNEQVAQLFEKGLGRKEVRKIGGGVTTGAPVLKALGADHPIALLILEYRGVDKLIGTYITKFEIGAKDGYVYEDGLIHCQFSIHTARTSRLASENPNNQNWPKRKNKEVRKQIKAPPGWCFLSVDQGQIEARVLAMESCDPVWVRMIEEKYDVHQEWAQKIARIDKDFGALLKAESGKARHRAKNEWVFPAFYGSSLNSIIRNLELQKDVAEKLFDEFWSTFQGIKAWQKRQWSKYQRDLYVESLSGRRRYGPLSWNQVINTPIQGEASDICVDGMIRLFNQSIELDLPWLCPVLQIHDDLTFLVPKKKLDYATEIVVKTCLAYDRSWVNVPLMVEAETGPDLFNMKSIGEFSSDDF